MLPNPEFLLLATYNVYSSWLGCSSLPAVKKMFTKHFRFVTLMSLSIKLDNFKKCNLVMSTTGQTAYISVLYKGSPRCWRGKVREVTLHHSTGCVHWRVYS